MSANHKNSIEFSEDLNGAHCDVLVIGAGPSGALATYLLARQGLNVVLVDKAIFPRHKVCGCCLSPTALQTLHQAGLDNLLDESSAIPLTEFRLSLAEKSLVFPLHNFKSISRSRLDNSIVELAIKHGARFLPGHTAVIMRKGKSELAEARIKQSKKQNEVQQRPERRRLAGFEKLQQRDLVQGHSEWIQKAKVIIVADGLGGNSTQEFPELAWTVRKDSYIGIGAISAAAPSYYRDGTIYMNYGKGGYLGLVRLEDGSTDIAAALSPHYLQANNGDVSKSAARLMNECGVPLPADLDSIPWKGTVSLTRKRKQVASHRIFVIGDSASYVEPFTGEGIAWALKSAYAVVPVVVQAVGQWHPKLIFKWQREYTRLISQSQSKTKIVTELLRHPQFSAPAAQLLSLPFATSLLGNFIFRPDPKVEQKLCTLQ